MQGFWFEKILLRRFMEVWK